MQGYDGAEKPNSSKMRIILHGSYHLDNGDKKKRSTFLPVSIMDNIDLAQGALQPHASSKFLLQQTHSIYQQLGFI